MKYSEVFVPGGMPKYTYNPRKEQGLEEELAEIHENLCKLVVVTGNTKSGKTVLVRKIVPPEESIWIDGGIIGSEAEFWQLILDELNLFNETQISEEDTNERALSVKGKVEGSAIIAKGSGEVSTSSGKGKKKGVSKKRSLSPRVVALEGLKTNAIPLVIDDFHYLVRELQGNIVRALKQLIFDGLPVVLIAIPHRRYDALKVEREMTGRIFPISIPPWEENELAYIPSRGFDLLNTKPNEYLIEKMCKEAIGSPHLIQDFCRTVCKSNSIRDDSVERKLTINEGELITILNDVAESIGRPMFDKLARGPRQRTDRIPRRLSDGNIVDIYGLTLTALAHLKPGLETIEYEELRTAIREVGRGNIPQLHEVSRVLKHMSNIAASDESSTPVIDFEEEEKKLHITDPFFAFFLRYGDTKI